MKAVTWQGKRDVRVDTVPDPKIIEPTDAIVRVTSSGICGSDLHLYETLGSSCVSRACSPSARRRRYAARARARHCWATRSSTGRSPAARPSTCGCRIDRLGALLAAIATARRGGTISLSGVYGGMVDPLPMMELFDKQIQLRMGQANVRRWIDDILPLVTGDGDPLGTEDFTTHTLPLADAPHGYEIFQRKQDGAIKVLLRP